MPRRPLPSAAEAADILARKRTRPVRRALPTVGRPIGKYLKSIDGRFGGQDILKARWTEIVGDALARSTEPVKLAKARKGEGATLELKVDGPAAVLIQHQAADIVARANLILGDGAVARLRVVQGPVRAAAERPAAPARRKRTAAPLDAAAEAELRAGLDAAPDTPLKAALLKLGRAVLRHRSG